MPDLFVPPKGKTMRTSLELKKNLGQYGSWEAPYPDMPEGLERDMERLFEVLVPDSGAAETLAGELIRAASCIGYQWNNNGCIPTHGEGVHSSGPALAFLVLVGPRSVSQAAKELEAEFTPERLYGLMSAVVAYVDQGIRTPNQYDMLEDRYGDYADKNYDYEYGDDGDEW